MKYLVTSAEMKEYDNNTIEHMGIPALVLMERAALSVREQMKEMVIDLSAKSALIAVGSGNNGADGLALARLLAEDGMNVFVVECADTQHATESYKKQRDILAFYDVCFLGDLDEAKERYDFIIDGIFGVGLSRTVNEKFAGIIAQLNQMKGIKLAIDIPSGIDGTTGMVMGCAFCADVTVTFGFPKRGLYLYPGTEYAGEVKVKGIGIGERAFFGHDPEMFMYDESPADLLPLRIKSGNKGTFGKVLLIAGWENMAGAAIMSAKAALQIGAGMVKVFCSEGNRSILQCAVPEAMYGNKETLLKDIKWADVIVAGPGMGQSEEAAEVLQTVLDEIVQTPKALLLDADALNLLASGKICVYKKQRIVMTPHVGELARLTGKEISYIKSHIVEVAKAASLDYDSVMVCKDARTYVHAAGHSGYLNISGNSGMATAGSGDVLSGIIAGLLAQGQDLFAAACTGVYLHGLAGDEAAEKVSEYGVTATRIIAQLKDMMKGS